MPNKRNKRYQKNAKRWGKLIAVIRAVHAQHADDLCWMPADVNRIFEAAGLPPQDLSVGDKPAMLRNCERYVACLQSGGPWKSYAELEAEVKELRERIRTEIDVDPDQILAMCGQHWVDNEVKERLGRLRTATEKLERIVCVKEPDRGVVLKSEEAPTRWNPEQQCYEYILHCFSPLGEALIELHEVLTGEVANERRTQGQGGQEVGSVPRESEQDQRSG